MHATHLVIGGGSAGCVMAARLSEEPGNNVVLVEAGADHAPDSVPDDIRDTHSGSALMNPNYFWKQLKVCRHADAAPVYYEQGRVLGGGSSVNGQVALRGNEKLTPPKGGGVNEMLPGTLCPRADRRPPHLTEPGACRLG